jgi:8-oxo-dGTP pyrophosphatase MutT (NUDIX family)
MMSTIDTAVPEGARVAARVLLFDEKQRILLLEAEIAPGSHRFWLMPGGGKEPGETFEGAAQRELYEETGLLLPVHHWVWTRRHIFPWQGRTLDQYERFFVARVENPHIEPGCPDGYILGHRWWDVREIQESKAEFAPRRLGALLPAIVRGEYPDSPIDCGV